MAHLNIGAYALHTILNVTRSFQRDRL